MKIIMSLSVLFPNSILFYSIMSVTFAFWHFSVPRFVEEETCLPLTPPLYFSLSSLSFPLLQLLWLCLIWNGWKGKAHFPFNASLNTLSTAGFMYSTPVPQNHILERTMEREKPSYLHLSVPRLVCPAAEWPRQGCRVIFPPCSAL